MKTRRTQDLIGSEYNPRAINQHDFDALKDSIKRFGMVDPLIVNTHEERENIVVGGHQRLKAAKELQVEEVPVVEVSLDKEREKELNVRLNRNTGQWDWSLLRDNFEKNELINFGFEEAEVDFTTGDPNDFWEQAEPSKQPEEEPQHTITLSYNDPEEKEETERKLLEVADTVEQAVSKLLEK